MTHDFTGVKSISIPEGTVVKITRKYDGAVKWQKTFGTAIKSLAIGSIVKLNVNGAPTNFIVVNHGRPSSDYDISCEGTWLLSEKVDSAGTWHSSSSNNYANSRVNTYLNVSYFGSLDNNIQNIVKNVIIPYTNGTGSEGSLAVGANGFPTKVFLLSGREVGYTSTMQINSEGAPLEFFNGAENSKRVAKNPVTGTAVNWWLRSPETRAKTSAWIVMSSGSFGSNLVSQQQYVRPALVLPSDNVYVDSDNNVIV